jgi:hypothetical protein
MTPDARSIASDPTSERSETTACWRSASICCCALAVIRAASAVACSLISAAIAVASTRACSRMRPASTRAWASWAVSSSLAASASACARSAFSMPPAIASERASSSVYTRGSAYFQMTSRRTTNTTADHTMS